MARNEHKASVMENIDANFTDAFDCMTDEQRTEAIERAIATVDGTLPATDEALTWARKTLSLAGY